MQNVFGQVLQKIIIFVFIKDYILKKSDNYVQSLQNYHSLENRFDDPIFFLIFNAHDIDTLL